MPLAKHHDMVKAFPSDRSNQPLTIAIHRPKAPDEGLAINAVPIADEIGWLSLPKIISGRSNDAIRTE